MLGNSSGVLHINGKVYSATLPTDGIALSHDASVVYYSTISTPYLFSVSATALADFYADNAKIGKTVVRHGYKGVSDGLAADDQGNLFYGNLELNAVGFFFLEVILRRFSAGNLRHP